MISMLWFALGLVVGAVASPILLPMLRKRFPSLGRLSAAMPTAIAPSSSVDARIASAIADIEDQIRNRVDVERNAVRLAQLREVRG